MAVLLRGENGYFFGGRNVAERKLQRETVHLRFGQWVGSAEFDRVFRGDDKKQVGKVAAFAVNAHLAFAHGFEQGRLRARRSTVDFVSQQDIREDGAFVKMKLLVALIEDGNAQDI